MIISASRRTDIPAFYSEWFMNRVRAGYCLVPNPYNRAQVSRVSLQPVDVDVIVFWTRNPRPLFSRLAELDDSGYRYCFLVTLMDNPRQIDPGSPPVEAALQNFRGLSERIGPERVVWRYDPIFLSSITDSSFHERAYSQIARTLKGFTTRSVVSVAQPYRKIRKRLHELGRQGIEILPHVEGALSPLMRALAETASMNGMEIRSCAGGHDMRQDGIEPGRCVDDEVISRVFGLDLDVGKDPRQRKDCGCVVSKDIGMYDSCPCGCIYCYATTSFEQARENYRMHDPRGPSMLGWSRPAHQGLPIPR